MTFPGVPFIVSIMVSRRAAIILLIAFALLVQNTCPLGAAGKSTVASECEHCPLHHQASAGPGPVLSSSTPDVHYPLYVLSVTLIFPEFGLASVESASPVLEDRYQDALPAGLLHPPRA